MTTSKPPPPPPGPRFESYRPAQERMDPRAGHPAGHPDGQPTGRPVYQGQAGHMRPREMRRPERPQRSRLLAGLLYGLLGMVALAAGAAAFVVIALPAEVVRDRIVAAVKARTGRDLVIAGNSSFTLYPLLGFALRDVSLSSPAGMTGKPLVTMASLDVSVRLLPLLKREVAINTLLLRQPQFNFEVDQQGRTTWEFAALDSHAEPARPVRLAQAPAPASDAKGGLASDAPNAAEPSRKRLANLDKLQLGDVRIEDGTVRYADARSGTRQEITSLDMGLALPSISSPLDANGSLAWKGKKVDFNAKLTSIEAVLDELPAKLALGVRSEAVTASFDGAASFKDGLGAEGTLTAKAPSVRVLAKWLGAELPPSQGFGPLEARGQLRAANRIVTLTNAEVALDGATATGQIAVDTAAERPLVKAILKLSELNLNTYMSGGGEAGPEPAPPKAGKPGAAPAPELTIDDLLEREPPAPGPKVKGFTRRAGWSEEPIDLTALGLIDADAKLSVARLLVREIKVGQSELTFALKNHVMKTTFDDVRLYDGRGRGFITVDASSSKLASVGVNLAFEGISALPFLKDAAAIDWLAGKGKLQFALAGQGATERQIVETMNGKADFTFTDGAIVGINIPQMVRGFGQGRIGEAKTAPTEKTDFTELAATWTVSGGVAQNQDLRLIGPLLRVSGAGSVMLPARELDYTMRPKLVANLSGQGGQQILAGLEIPVRIQGSWEKPKFKPDLDSVLKDPNKAADTIKEIGKQFKGKSAGEIVKGLFGGGDNQDGEESSKPAPLDQLQKR